MNSSTTFNAATSGSRGAPACAPIDNGAPEWSPENANANMPRTVNNKQTPIAKRLQRIILTLCMALTLVSVFSIPAFAADHTVTTAGELTTALSTAASGDIIILGANITYNSAISVSSKTIYFDLGNYDLTVDTSTGADDGLYVNTGGKIIQIGSGTGIFTIKAQYSGIYARGVGSEVIIRGNIETPSNVGVEAHDGAKVTVIGDVTLTAPSAMIGIWAATGAEVIIDGTMTVAANYIEFDGGVKTAAQYEATSTKPGYLELEFPTFFNYLKFSKK